MNTREKLLYQQIHPLKLLTDWIGAFIASYLIWVHQVMHGLLVGFIPSLIVSALVVRFANLEKLKNSAFGKYISWYMTRRIEAVRLLGLAIWWGTAWYNFAFGEALGIAIIVAAWAGGLFSTSNSNAANN